MLNQDDKKFITLSITQALAGLKAELKKDIRENGVIMEQIKDDVKLLGEGQKVHTRQLSVIQSDIKKIRTFTVPSPAVQQYLKGIITVSPQPQFFGDSVRWVAAFQVQCPCLNFPFQHREV